GWSSDVCSSDLGVGVDVNACWPTHVDLAYMCRPTIVGMNQSKAPAPARRSDATRRAILDAARERFAADGYERATIRAIAQQAQIDPSMVMRYYGNKEGLFAAAAAIDLQLPDPASLPRDDAGHALVTHVLHMWEDNDLVTALLRVGITNETGAERMRGIF